MMTAFKDGFLPFAQPDIGEEEVSEVVHALRSGWITTGPKTRQFEQDFAAYIGGGVQAIAVNSATAGLHLALEAIGIGAGDQVIIPSYTFTATAEVVRYLGADPIFADIDPATLNISPADIERRIGPRTRAIIVVHFAGLACDMTAILAIARTHGLRVIEDAAHALPTTHGGALVGSLASDVTVFSFYATKTVATGEGGMVVTRDSAIADRCRVMRLHGISRDAFDRYTSRAPSWHYEVIAPGFKYNLTDLASAIGIHQLRKADRFRDARGAIAAAYDQAFEGLPVITPPRPAAGDVHAWHLYVIRLATDAGVPRDRFIAEMSERRIGCSVHFIPLHIQPYWRETYRLAPADLPHSMAAYEAAVSLPIYTKMTESDCEQVITAARSILTSR